jgi:hypothetical protein
MLHYNITVIGDYRRVRSATEDYPIMVGTRARARGDYAREGDYPMIAATGDNARYGHNT